MKFLLLGANGQVGWELQRSLMPLGEVLAVGRVAADLAEPEHLRDLVRGAGADVIVNAAAYTAVDRAEQEVALAMAVNAEAPAVLADEASRSGALLVHYSTDYVFDGLKASPYVESDPVAPLNRYGASKLAGEKAITGSGCDHLVLRTSWVYGARGSNFLLTMLRLMRERESLSVIEDQVGAPTWARLIAEATAQIVAAALRERRTQRFASGIYHLTSSGSVSWHGFAAKIAELARQGAAAEIVVRDIHPVLNDEYPSATRRPLNSRLNTDAVCERFDIHLPAWDQALALCMADCLPS